MFIGGKGRPIFSRKWDNGGTEMT
jgi:sulfane dehydrogenase subunit SoxC